MELWTLFVRDEHSMYLLMNLKTWTKLGQNLDNMVRCHRKRFVKDILHRVWFFGHGLMSIRLKEATEISV